RSRRARANRRQRLFGRHGDRGGNAGGGRERGSGHGRRRAHGGRDIAGGGECQPRQQFRADRRGDDRHAGQRLDSDRRTVRRRQRRRLRQDRLGNAHADRRQRLFGRNLDRGGNAGGRREHGSRNGFGDDRLRRDIAGGGQCQSRQ